MRVMRVYFAALITVLCVSSAFSQSVPAGFDISNYGVQIEPDKRVIMVLATLDAARTVNEKGESVRVINTSLPERGTKFRELLSSDFAGMNEGLRQRISAFVLAHKRRNPKISDSQLIAPFISMAYTLSSVPELSDPVVTNDLPGNLLDVLDFAPLVRDVYRTTNIGANLNDYVKQYREAASAKARPTATYMVNELLSYMHTRPNLASFERVKTQTLKSGSKKTTLQQTTFKEKERRFVIVPELLAPEGYVNFVNIKDDYFVVIPAEADLTNSEVRRAYLQFVVDPLVLANAKEIESIRVSVKQLLDERRKSDPSTSPDVFLTITRSLVAAIDAKQIEFVKNLIATDLARTRIAAVGGSDPSKKIAQDLEKAKRESADETILRLSEDYERGALLAFYFADQLNGVEASQTDIAASMREMILSIDSVKESDRYAGYSDIRKRATLAREERRKALSDGVVSENPVTTKLLEIQDSIKGKNYSKAEADLKQLLSQHPSEPRIYFNIGRLAAISAETIDGEADSAKQRAKYLEAKVAFENVLRIDIAQRKTPSGPQADQALISLTYVSLGRIYEYYGDRGTALGIYDTAIRLGPVAGGGYREAFESKQRLVKEQ